MCDLLLFEQALKFNIIYLLFQTFYSRRLADCISNYHLRHRSHLRCNTTGRAEKGRSLPMASAQLVWSE